MTRYPRGVIFICTAIGMAFGFEIALEFGPRGINSAAAGLSNNVGVSTDGSGMSAAPAVTEHSDSVRQTSCIPTPMTQSAWVDELVTRIKSPTGDSASGGAAFASLIELAHSNPEVLENLIGRYANSADQETKNSLRSVLTSFPSQRVMDLAVRLSRGNPEQRKDGYVLLAMLPYPDSRGLIAITQALESEKDVTVLGQALKGLLPGQVLDPAQTESTLARLGTLVQSTDPIVRGESLRALAQADKKGDIAEDAVYKALEDPNPVLRGDALFAINSSPLKSDRVKTALLNILLDTAEKPDVQLMAVRAIERFALTDTEYVVYNQVNTLVNQQRLTAGHGDGGITLFPFARYQK
jgi:hypothetical protein